MSVQTNQPIGTSRPQITHLIDLHLHLDGAMSVSNARQIAALQGIELNMSDEQMLSMMQVGEDCRSLADFLTKFAFPCSLLQTSEGIENAMYNLCEELRSDGLIYAEIRFAPSRSCEKGLTQDEVVAAAIRGLKRSTLPAQIILSCMRGGDEKANMLTIKMAAKYLGKGVCAADLAGPEEDYPTQLYQALLHYAQTMHVPFTVHAGEAAGATSVENALACGASRIGHGVRSLEDITVVETLVKNHIPLEVCPTSNVKTCIFASVDEVPLREMLSHGLQVTINSDDPAVEGISLRKEWDGLIDAFDLSKEEVYLLMSNSVCAAFVDDNMRAQLQQQIDEAYHV